MWKCKNCGNAENELNWETCWKCGDIKSVDSMIIPGSNEIIENKVTIKVHEICYTYTDNYKDILKQVEDFCNAVKGENIISISPININGVVRFQIWYSVKNN